MSAIDWRTTVAALDADPDITTPAGTIVLSNLISAGRQYDSAGKPDVLHESPQHQQWASLRPSERIGLSEPAFYESSYYARLVPNSASSKINKRQFSVDDLAVLPPDAVAAYRFWSKRAEQLPDERATSLGTAQRIAVFYIAAAEQADRDARSAASPTYGRIEGELVAAMSAAQAFLAA